MAGRLAIDFGTSNTVVAVWDPTRQTGSTPPLAGLSVAREHEGAEFHVIPSLIHYDGHRVRVGRQVSDESLSAAPSTFRWMKTYVGNGMRLPRRVGDGRSVDNFQAAQDFLGQVLLAAGGLANLAEEEIALTLPVESFEQFGDFLDRAAREAGASHLRFVDEASAAALGYAARVKPGQAFMVFDFGGGTVDVAIVRVEEGGQGGRRCSVLGKQGAQVGGSTIDQWLMRDVVARTGTDEARARAFSGLLLAESERVKEALTSAELAEFATMDPDSGAVVAHTYGRGAFEDLLEKNGLYTKLNTVLDLAEAQARERGHDRDSLGACLMIGGSSLIPSVRRLVRMRYGERTRTERPFDAVAVGAAAYVAGVDFEDRIRHAYALRTYDPQKQDYVFRTIVPAGTSYPTPIMDPKRPAESLALTVKATSEGQTRLGMQVFEVSHKESLATGGGGFELVFDEGGAARLSARDDPEDATHRPMGSTTFIVADPPAKKGEPRFIVSFAIDGQRRLCVTVRDAVVGKVLMRDQPMVKLT